MNNVKPKSTTNEQCQFNADEFYKALDGINKFIQSGQVNDNEQKQLTTFVEIITNGVNQLTQLKNEIEALKKKSSDDVMVEIYAHLLSVCVKAIEKKFQENNEINKFNIDKRYNFPFHYSAFNLKKIKHGNIRNDDKALHIIKDVIMEYCELSDMPMNTFIDLLLMKKSRNFLTHGFINNFVNEVINENVRKNDLLARIKKQTEIEVVLSEEEQNKLTNLLEMNIRHHKSKHQLRDVIWGLCEPEGVISSLGVDPFRMVVAETYTNKGTIVKGIIDSGTCSVGDECLVMPNGTRVQIEMIYHNDSKINSCTRGQDVRIAFKNIRENISSGFILCDVQQAPCRVGRVFNAQFGIVEHTSIICPGYSAVLRIHAAIADVQLKKLIALVDHQTEQRTEENPTFIKEGQVAIATFELSKPGQTICMELFEHFPRLGRFTLDNDGPTLAIGKVLEIIE